jgi:hypothetical protein
MSNQSYLYNAPAGVPGTVTRLQDSTVDTVLLGEAFTAFGVPFKFNSAGKAVNIESGDAATLVKGFIARSVPSISGASGEAFGDGAPSQDSPCGGLRKGFISVKCNVGTPVKGGQVFIRNVAATGKPVGSLETAAVTDEVVALPGVEWAVNGKDSNNITEIYKQY